MPDEPSPLEPVEDEIEEVLDEVDAIEETLAFHAITSELRHEQILEGIAECRANLENLSNQVQTQPQGESPANSRILSELAGIRTAVTALREQQMMSSSPTPQPSQSQPSNPPAPDAVVDPQVAAPNTPTKKKRFVKI